MLYLDTKVNEESETEAQRTLPLVIYGHGIDLADCRNISNSSFDSL